MGKAPKQCEGTGVDRQDDEENDGDDDNDDDGATIKHRCIPVEAQCFQLVYRDITLSSSNA